MAACTTCGGMGKSWKRREGAPGLVMVDCPECGGSGKVAHPHQIYYPPEVIDALQQARQSLQTSAAARIQATPRTG